ncbi:MAG: GNAT family N-acetyltransferase [Frankiaceae bacterium]|nr:GNAT family N-acetyltransferase [Frankiaceae bacterium]MBV9369562.1 GNAT family N-acetyltransferase [Frankiales bacterium]
MTAADVRLITADEFAPLVVVAAQIYGEAMRRPPELVVQRREIIQSHLQRQGFRAVAARVGDELVGFAYGYRGRAGEWWHDIVAKALSRDSAREWLSDAFELAELHLLPAHHGNGIGRAILTTILDGLTTQTAVLSTHDHDSPARSLYRSAGFEDLLTGFVFPGSTEVYAVMGRRQPTLQ